MGIALVGHMTTTPTDTREQTISEVLGPNTLSGVVRELAEVIRSEGNIGVVFGSPMALEKHKIIPVARVEIGFGGGIGGSIDRNGNGVAKHLGALARIVRRGFGAGGGGGIKVIPLGFIHEDGERIHYRAIPSEST